MKKPELLSPAGSLKAMRYAYAYGADAVYAGQPRYSLRVRENEFSKLEVMADAITEAHSLGKKFYIASNISPHNLKVRTYIKNMEPVIAMQPDALIMSDPGLIMMVREAFPDTPVHLSVQANCVNYATVKFWQKLGLERIILSRELSLKEIAEMREECPEMELEVFVHGALCIAYSGRCLLSGYMSYRDSNQGACTNACRWEYKVNEAEQNMEGDIVLKNPQPALSLANDGPSYPDLPIVEQNPLSDEVFLLEEAGRHGDLMPAYEDEHGTYIMNSKDLRAIQHVKTFCDMGMSSLKIEGRTKSFFYAARTAQVYRRAIDDAVAGKEFDGDLMTMLDSLSNRGYTDAFYSRHMPNEMQTYEHGRSVANQQKFVGDVIEVDNDFLTVEVKNKFEVGEEVELMTPAGNVRFTLNQMFDVKGNPEEVAPGSGHFRKIPLEGNVSEEIREALQGHAGEFALLMKFV
ncbi:prephenate-dependent tRNA uridine(34) hydroxylase TrhP [Polystyrenella longa]|nr:tRNA 5-hydroxyuridine modification protein YegQ [Polystyrenella longa]